MTPCSEPGCGRLVERGRCSAHGAQHRADTRPEYDKWYRTARWRQIRAIVLAEQPLCRDCLAQQRTTPSQDVDHEVPHRGDYDAFWDGPFVALCRSCHSRKTARGG